MFTKLTKWPVHWSSIIPANYKRVVINSKLHRAKEIATDFNKELRSIKTILHAAYPVKFIHNSLSWKFNALKEELFILKYLFEGKK